MVNKLNKIQELNLQLIEETNFNNFNGQSVAEDLRKHKKLWEAVIMDTESYSDKKGELCIELLKLRDMSDNFWNVDTIFILTDKEDIQLERIANRWGADEVEWLPKEQVGKVLGSYPADKNILKVWWD